MMGEALTKAAWPVLVPVQGMHGAGTRSVVAFLEKTAIAYRQNLAFFLQFGWYAIAVFSKNATTLRVCRIWVDMGIGD